MRYLILAALAAVPAFAQTQFEFDYFRVGGYNVLETPDPEVEALVRLHRPGIKDDSLARDTQFVAQALHVLLTGHME